MGFRTPLTVPAALDSTDAGRRPGVRVYTRPGNPSAGVVEWSAGAATATGQLVASDTGSGGSVYSLGLSGGPALQLNREELPGGGYRSVARIDGADSIQFGGREVPRGVLSSVAIGGTARAGAAVNIATTGTITLPIARRCLHHAVMRFYGASTLQRLTVRLVRYTGGVGTLVQSRQVDVGGTPPNDGAPMVLLIDDTPPAGSYVWAIDLQTNITAGTFAAVAYGDARYIITDQGA